MSDILVHTSKSVYVGFSILARTHEYDRASVKSVLLAHTSLFYNKINHNLPYNLMSTSSTPSITRLVKAASQPE